MRNIIYIAGLMMFCMLQLSAQENPTGRQVRETPPHEFLNVALFSSKTTISQRATVLSNYVSKFDLLEVNETTLAKIAESDIARMELSIPLNEATVTLQLIKNNFITPQTIFTTQNGTQKQAVNYKTGTYYRGIIKGKANTFVAISFYNNNIIGVIADENGNRVLGKSNTKDSRSTEYILYNERDLMVQSDFECGTISHNNNAAVNIQKIPSPNLSPQDWTYCLRIYIETDYQLYLDHGSNVTEVINFVSGVFNAVSTLYSNEYIPTMILQVNVFTSPDPYMVGNQQKEGTLTLFENAMNRGFNGDVAQLFSSRDLKGGKAAEVGGLCMSYFKRVSVIGELRATTDAFPTYSWNANVSAHEIGHTLGSQHTHECFWGPLGLTAIDGCAHAAGYPMEDMCSPGGLPFGGGTIMSYCHLIPQTVGINFAKGFGTEPGDRIRSRIMRATTNHCLGPCCVETLLISGVYSYRLAQVSKWIKSNGQTFIQSDVTVRLDAPADGYIELTSGAGATNYFMAAPDNEGAFIAQPLDGCAGGIPTINTGIETTDKLIKSFELYPNPTAGIFKLNLALNANKNVKITIYNTLGQEVYTNNFGSIAEVHTLIDISKYNEGIYLVKVEADELIQTKQLITIR